jgi:phosphohistidine swiveling domain-containing protein
MPNKQKDDWEELIRSDLCLYNTNFILNSIQYSDEFVKGPRYRRLFLYLKDSVGYYYENFKDHYTVGEHCLNLFLKDRKKFAAYMKFWHKTFQKHNILLEKLRKTDLSKLPKEKLADLLEQVNKSAMHWHGVAYNVDAIDATLNPLIQKAIEEMFAGKKKSEISAAYNTITFPDTLSYANRMNIEQLALLINIKEKGREKAQKDIKSFLDSYYWVNFQFGESKELTEEQLLSGLKGKSIRSLKKEHSSVTRKFAQSLKDKKKLLQDMAGKGKKLTGKEEKLARKGNNHVMLDYIQIFDEYAVLHDLRKEGQVKSVSQIRRIYNELAKRLKVKPGLLYYIWPQELVELARQNKKPDMGLMERRKKVWLCDIDNTGKSIKCIEYFGEEATKRRDAALGYDEQSAQKELSGMGASQGRVIGRAKICLSAKIADEKIGEGDILVTGMTMPEFITAMKCAAGIVTDEGGLTCHAAIISRELGKPCIVGTKMATRLIKEGDLLEVNANHGVVKIISHAEK